MKKFRIDCIFWFGYFTVFACYSYFYNGHSIIDEIFKNRINYVELLLVINIISILISWLILNFLLKITHKIVVRENMLQPNIFSSRLVLFTLYAHLIYLLVSIKDITLINYSLVGVASLLCIFLALLLLEKVESITILKKILILVPYIIYIILDWITLIKR